MLKKLLLIAVVNLFILGFLVGINLYTLTYTCVPVDMQHMWFGTDLKTYLCFQHTVNTIMCFLLAILYNVTILKKYVR